MTVLDGEPIGGGGDGDGDGFGGGLRSGSWDWGSTQKRQFTVEMNVWYCSYLVGSDWMGRLSG